MPASSYWIESRSRTAYSTLAADLNIEVCVVGGGIAGVTAAYLLRKAGHSVALLESDRCGAVDTGHTTAHLTQVTDARLNDLVARFGRDHAQAAWHAGRAAIEQIHETSHALSIDCGFAWTPGYLHTRPGEQVEKDELEKLHDDARLASEFGFDAAFMKSVPFMGTPGVRFANQARFHPLKHLDGLLEAFTAAGGRVFENTEVREVTAKPHAVLANGHRIVCDWVVLATHVPLMGVKWLLPATAFQSKLAAYSSYVVAARTPAGAVPDALFWDTADPYRYLRVERGSAGDIVIFGGEDHKTGQPDGNGSPYEALEQALSKLVPAATVSHRWTGQVIEPYDGLPFIGEIEDRQFIATGFSGNGMTFGTLSGMMACDAVCGRKNPWSSLFDPRRKTLASVWDYVKENVDYPYYMIRDRLASTESMAPENLKPGEGALLKLNGERVAASRSKAGALSVLSPVCPHMGCLVRWNGDDSTWDCPCHGSRFQATGEKLAGPAESDLKPAAQ